MVVYDLYFETWRRPLNCSWISSRRPPIERRCIPKTGNDCTISRFMSTFDICPFPAGPRLMSTIIVQCPIHWTFGKRMSQHMLPAESAQNSNDFASYSTGTICKKPRHRNHPISQPYRSIRNKHSTKSPNPSAHIRGDEPLTLSPCFPRIPPFSTYFTTLFTTGLPKRQYRDHPSL